MKKLMMTTIMLGSVTLQAENLPAAGGERLALIEEYKMMFSKIGEKRIGASTREIEAVRPPFIRLSKEEAKKVVVKKDGTKVAVKSGYVLQAIVNDRAKINGKWYKKGDRIDDYTLVSIQSSGLFLQNNEFKKRLTLRKKNEKISIK
ncbi:MAG TPA: hypothetical protein ENK97_02855 [Campylobacteraceae bacterium]|nr:hypothetical protein [Campylobacteraceae bacterium]